MDEETRHPNAVGRERFQPEPASEARAGAEQAVSAATGEAVEATDRWSSPGLDESSSSVERAQRAVLELNARRALEQRYAQEREQADELIQRPRDDMRHAAPPPRNAAELSAFDY